MPQQLQNNELNQNNNQLLSPIYRFFCWCSGARLYILKNCPSEFNKYFGIGAVVLMTGVMAAISGGYALHTVFENINVSIVFGIIWGALIFFIDWFIVASLKKENKFHKEFLAVIPRLILAVFLSLIISKPLELRLFKNEIDQEIATMQRDRALNYKNMVFKEFDQIEALTKENQRLIDEITKKENYRNQLFTMIVEEAEGRSPTQKVGKGPVYKEKKAEYDLVNEELESLKKRNYDLIKQNDEQIAALRSQRQQEINDGNISQENYDGLLAKLQAIGSLSAKNQTIYFTNLFIILLFIIVESAPIIIKLISKRGPYDELLDVEEMNSAVEAKKYIAAIESNHDIDIQLMKETGILKFDANRELNRKFIEKLVSANEEINAQKILSWKNEQVESLKNNPDEVYRAIEQLVNRGLISKE